MNKLELNDKLAELYGIEPKNNYIHVGNGFLLIDDWSRLMELSVANKLRIENWPNGVWVENNDFDGIEIIYSDHESPQAATRFAIAMALVKLKEDK